MGTVINCQALTALYVGAVATLPDIEASAAIRIAEVGMRDLGRYDAFGVHALQCTTEYGVVLLAPSKLAQRVDAPESRKTDFPVTGGVTQARVALGKR